MRWRILDPDQSRLNYLMREFQAPEIIARMIANRRIESLELSCSFFEPSVVDFHDPFLMKDMRKAVDRIAQNIRSGDSIFVFGDYDVDGTSSSLLYTGITALGGKVVTYIPNRDNEGYGLSELGIDTAKRKGSNLLITCDCGINAFDRINYATEMNIDVIITDHHIPGDTIPQALAVLNPKQIDYLYPFKELCGCGVALKLMTDLTKKFNASFELIIDLLDLAALGTAADLVPMVDENRLIVSFGLETLKNTKRLGIRELLKVAGVDLDRNLNVSQVVFHVAPRINAAGRLGDANRVVELLTTTAYNTAAQLARELDEENKRRQTIQQEVIDEAILMVNSNVDLENDVAIILGSEGWHQGVAGIVASKLKEMYHRPSLIISFDKEGVGKGSARSINSLDLYKALDFTKHWLHNYGGHAMAAGLSLKKSNFNSFRKEFMEYAKSVLKTRDLEPVIILEGELLLLDINRRFMKFLEKLGPYGPGNMHPKFAVRSVDIVGNPRIIGNGDHFRFQVKQGYSTFPVIGFNLASKYENLILGQPVDIACVVETNIWKGIESVQLNARDIQLSASANGRT